jgi:antitoxin Phd
MQVWPVQDAKARFSEFLDACMTDGPQMVTRRGAEAAVLVPVERPGLKELLLSDAARMDIPIPPRGRLRRRPVVEG